MGVQSGGISASSGLSTVGIILTLIVTLVALIFGGYTSGTDQTFQQGIIGFISKAVLYMPNVLFGYGFIADIFNNTGYHYSIASTTALLGMVINKTIGSTVGTGISFIAEKVRQAPVMAAALATAATVAVAPAAAAAATGIEMTAMPAIAAAPAAAVAAAPVIAPAAAAAAVGTAAASTFPPVRPLPADGVDPGPPPPMTGGFSDICSLPGFEWLENKIAPQGIIMSMTVLWYLMIELWDTGSGGQTVALGVTTAITFAVQWLVLAKSGCLDSYRFTVYSPLIALVMAITFAGTSYGIQKVIRRNISSGGVPVPPVPSGTPGTFVCPPGTVLSTSGDSCVTPLGPGGIQPTNSGTIINVGGKNETSAPVDDNDQFVCEAYKDGELVTSTIVD